MPTQLPNFKHSASKSNNTNNKSQKQNGILTDVWTNTMLLAFRIQNLEWSSTSPLRRMTPTCNNQWYPIMLTHRLHQIVFHGFGEEMKMSVLQTHVRWVYILCKVITTRISSGQVHSCSNINLQWGHAITLSLSVLLNTSNINANSMLIGMFQNVTWWH